MMETKKEAADENFLKLQKEMEQIRFRYLYESAVRSVMEITRREAEELEKTFHREILSSLSGRVKTPESIERKLERKGCAVNLEMARAKLNDIAGVRAACFFLDDVYELAKRLKLQDGFRVIKEKNYIENPKASGYKSLHLIVEVLVNMPVAKEKESGGTARERSGSTPEPESSTQEPESSTQEQGGSAQEPESITQEQGGSAQEPESSTQEQGGSAQEWNGIAAEQAGSTREPVRVELQLRTLAMDFWARLDHRLCYKKDLKAAKNVQRDLRKYAEIIARVDIQMLSLRKRIDAI